MNSIKNAKCISYSQQTYASMIVKLFLHLKWYYPIMPVNCYLKMKEFFPHDFTLIASVVGESVIGHGNGGKVSQLKWHDSLKASRWSKRQWSVLVTRSHSQSTSDGLEDPFTLTPHIIGDSVRRISTTSPIEVSYELLLSCELLRYHGVGSRT